MSSSSSWLTATRQQGGPSQRVARPFFSSTDSGSIRLTTSDVDVWALPVALRPGIAQAVWPSRSTFLLSPFGGNSQAAIAVRAARSSGRPFEIGNVRAVGQDGEVAAAQQRLGPPLTQPLHSPLTRLALDFSSLSRQAELDSIDWSTSRNYGDVIRERRWDDEALRRHPVPSRSRSRSTPQSVWASSIRSSFRVFVVADVLDSFVMIINFKLTNSQSSLTHSHACALLGLAWRVHAGAFDQNKKVECFQMI